ncbi:serine hydrolase [Chryseobacterium gwangjuense]|uniref:serine hydrolase n=1 Tax=Chryseobacterium gwangjuense TaxID=1069980 RepID=UPI001E59AC2B|nr:serine hydrolase [Chryseobacterium gwangjuense]MCE3076847.1 serine hydrolase [Chryseobacterium gwangjuense]
MLKNSLLIFIFLFALKVQGQTKEEKINNLVDAYSHLNRYNGSILVAEKGKIIFEKSFGIQDFQTQEKNTNESIYRIYSTTKTFTATLILLLNEEKKLSLTDKLSKYYPDFPKGDSITIENLLTHTSGIPEGTPPESTKNEATFLESIYKQPFAFSPGTNWSYSNPNYYILGYIIAKVSGISYQKALQHYILDPLGMKNTGFYFKELKNKNKTTGYEYLSPHNYREAVVYDYNHPHAAGAMYSTVEDLYKFYQGLTAYKILKKETLEKAQTPLKDYHYGYGWQEQKMKEKTIIGHDGGGPGFICRFLTIPEDDVCVIMLSNVRDNSVFEIGQKIMSIMGNQTYNTPKKLGIDTKQEAYLTGLYQSKDSYFYILANDNQLIFKETNQGDGILFTESNTKFYIDNNNGDRIFFNFKPDSNSKNPVLQIIIKDKIVKEAKKVNNNFLWGITGDATKNGWDGPDIKLTPSKSNKNILEARNIQLKSGQIKFRANNEWTLDLGINDDNQLVQYGRNISVEAGTYDIIFDTTNPIRPTYQLIKKK